LEKVKEQWKTDGTGHQVERAKEYIAHLNTKKKKNNFALTEFR